MKVVYYGIIQEKTEKNDEIITSTSTDELLNILESKYPFLTNITYTIFKNQVHIKDNEQLMDSDEVVLCPPFSGG